MQVRLQHVGEHEVLLVRHAHFAERIAVGERRDRVHLARRRVARRHAGALERQRDDRVTTPLVCPDVALGPARERTAVGDRGAERDTVASEVAIGGLREMSGEAGDLFARHGPSTAAQVFPLGLDLPREFGRRQFLHQDLDARLVDVVAAAVAVVDPKDRVEVVEELRRRQELANDVADDRRAALAAADDHLESRLAGGIAHHLHADVVDEDRRAIGRRTGDGDLELARQERELGIEASTTGG